MTDEELLAMIAAQRREIADLIESLNEEQLQSESLCAGWTAKDVAAHVTVPLHTSMAKFAAALAGSLGNFDKAMAKIVAKESTRSVADIATELRDQAMNPFKPPGGFGLLAPLDDVLVHTQDIRRPLGLGNGLADDRVLAVLRGTEAKKFDKVTKRKRFAGVRLSATDMDYAFGDGAVASGTGEAILMVLEQPPERARGPVRRGCRPPAREGGLLTRARRWATGVSLVVGVAIVAGVLAAVATWIVERMLAEVFDTSSSCLPWA